MFAVESIQINQFRLRPKVFREKFTDILETPVQQSGSRWHINKDHITRDTLLKANNKASIFFANFA